MLGAGLELQNGFPFTTKDRDNDNLANNCANEYQAGWWYENCFETCVICSKFMLNGAKDFQPYETFMAVREVL